MFLFGEYGIGGTSAGVLLTFLSITFVVVALLVLLVGFVVIVVSLYVRCRSVRRSVRLDPITELFISAPFSIVVSMNVSIDFLVIVVFGGVVAVFWVLTDLDDFDDFDVLEDFVDLVDVEFGSVFDMEFAFEYVVVGL